MVTSTHIGRTKGIQCGRGTKEVGGGSGGEPGEENADGALVREQRSGSIYCLYNWIITLGKLPNYQSH